LITIKTYIWNEQIHPDYSNERNVILNNSPEATLPDVKESLHTNRDAKRDEITIRAYNSTSKKMEKVEPKDGEIYEIITRTGSKLEYMVEDGKIYTDYTSADEKRISYYVSDLQGNILDYKFPHKLEEYTVVIPSDFELRRSERPLPNGWKFIEVDLKWGGKVEMILDPRRKLQQVKIEGGCRTNHKLKTIVAGRIDKTNKWMLPNKTDAGDSK
jgi:hypothetical protein